jgi:hypothetical protein
VIAKTKKERPKIDSAGVEAGAKMLGLACGPCTTDPCQTFVNPNRTKSGHCWNAKHLNNLDTSIKVLLPRAK